MIGYTGSLNERQSKEKGEVMQFQFVTQGKFDSGFDFFKAFFPEAEGRPEKKKGRT